MGQMTQPTGPLLLTLLLTSGVTGKIWTKLETVSIAEPLQNRQHVQNP